MADIVTGTVSGQVDMTQVQNGISDIRREQQQIGATVQRDVLSEAAKVENVVQSATTRLSDQGTAFYIAGQARDFDNSRDLSALRCQTDMGFQRMGAEIQTTQALNAAAAALESAKLAAAIALGQATLSKEIFADGTSTRALINDLNRESLNRELIERNQYLVESRGDARYWQHGLNNAQFAAVTTQMNSLASQFNDTKQGMVNFGTQTGVGQTSTSNNVR